MPGKAKQAHHTAKEINRKHHLAKMRNGGEGGGADGIVDRKAPKKEGKKDPHIVCKECLVAQPGLKSMKIHYENRHPKKDWATMELIYNPVEVKEEPKEDQNKWVDPNNYDDYDEDNYDYEENKEEETYNPLA